ncbi:hypothetical protein BH11MYX3_BH11MYX3_35860 [soil metagenome]
MSNQVSDEERQLVAATHLAAGLRAPDSSVPPDWMAFCWGYARDLYPMIDRGELDAARTSLTAVVDACLRMSSAANERLVFLLGLIRHQEALRDADRAPERPKASIGDVIPAAARAAMEVVWEEENQALRDAQHGY